MRERWWRLAFREDEACDEEDARERIRWLIDDATRLRMLSDVPIGAYLSGGVDSSAVVAAMARRSSGPVLTFTLGYEDELAHKEADLFHARRVAAAFGTEHHEHIMSRDEVVAGIDGVIRAFDQPFSGTVSTYFLSRLIARHVKVALSGDGADELFGSYLSHRLARPLAWCAARRAGLDGAERMPEGAKQEWSKMEALMSSNGKEDHYIIRKELRKTLDKNMGVFRTGEEMQAGLDKIRELKELIKASH